MSNTITTRGTITYVKRRPTNVFMTIKQDGRHGVSLVVKAFCPDHLKDTPDVWANHFRHHDIGTRVAVEGYLSFDKETTQVAGTSDRVPVKHPISGRDIYEPFIWASSIDILFDPAIHMVRPKGAPEQAKSPAQAGTAARSAPQIADDDLPPLPQDGYPASRASVAWNNS